MAKSGDVRAGGAYVEVSADSSPLKKELKSAQADVKGFGGFLKSAMKGAAFGGAAGAGFAAVSLGVKAMGAAMRGALQGVQSLIGAMREFSEANRNALSPEQVKAADQLKESFSLLDNSLTQLLQDSLTQLAPAFSGVVDIVRLAADGFGKWMQSSDALKGALSAVTNVITGIRDALSAGDWKLAGEIAMKGLKVAFLEGVVKIREVWVGLKTSIQQTMSEAFLGVSDMFDELITNLKIGLKKYWWAFGAAGLAASKFIDDPEKLRKDRNRRADMLGETVLDANASIAGMNNADVQKSRDAAAAAMADLTDSIKQANENAVSPHPLDLPMGEVLAPLPAEKKQEMKEAQDTAFRFSSAGTFSAAGASMLAGTTTRRLHDDTKKTAENTKSIAETNKGILGEIKNRKPGLAFT